MIDQSTEVERIAGQVLDYLVRNPEASDTLEGIAQWWLFKSKLAGELHQLREALELLETRKLIRKCTNSDGTVLYSGGDATRK